MLIKVSAVREARPVQHTMDLRRKLDIAEELVYRWENDQKLYCSLPVRHLLSSRSGAGL